MANHDLLIASLVVSCLAATSSGVTFSSLQNSLFVSASPKPEQVLRAGEDNITVTWSLNTSIPIGSDSEYKIVKIKLCYAPVSQQDRAWRKTVDNLAKDKTCQHKIVVRAFSPASNNMFTWKVKRDVPTATYFIRAYVHNSADEEVAYGQTTNLFVIDGISGRHVSLDVAAVCFSAFSIVSLFGFFYLEKRKSKTSLQS